jgi:hypothetical protein
MNKVIENFPESFSVQVNNEKEFNTAHHILMKLGFKASPYGNENFYTTGYGADRSTIRYTLANGYIWGSQMQASNHFKTIGDLVTFLLEPRLTERQKRIVALKEELVKLEAEEAAQ